MVLLMSLWFLGCKNHPKDAVTNKVETMGEIYIFGDKINRLPIESAVASDKSKLTTWLIANYFHGKPIDINLAETSGNIGIFNIEVKGDLATNAPRYYTFINASKENSYLVPIEFSRLLHVNNEIMFGGIYNYREYDYYFIYSVDGKDLKLTFDSRKINKEGLKIGHHRDDDCRKYQPNRFMIKYDDKTSISFHGVIKIFCKDGQNRTSQQTPPIKEEKVFIQLDYNGKSWVYNTNSEYEFW